MLTRLQTMSRVTRIISEMEDSRDVVTNAGFRPSATGPRPQI